MLRQPEDGFGGLGRDHLIFETTDLPRDIDGPKLRVILPQPQKFHDYHRGIARRGSDRAAKRIRVTQPGRA